MIITNNLATVDVHAFTVDGTWTMPPGAKFVEIVMVNGGGGGGGGGNSTFGSMLTAYSGGVGGAGGAGGQVTEVEL